jgi:hypothetical protein
MEVFGLRPPKANAAFCVRCDIVIPDDRDALFALQLFECSDHGGNVVGNPTTVNSVPFPKAEGAVVFILIKWRNKRLGGWF